MGFSLVVFRVKSFEVELRFLVFWAVTKYGVCRFLDSH